MPAFGPSAAAAELEGSKAFAKELMKEAGVPTAGHVLLRSREEAVEQLAASAYPAVLKADGLAAGKGVIICADEAEARDAVDVFFTERRFGATDGRAGGVPRGRGALAAGALRRRERGAAGAGPGLQADLRRRRGAEHRRHGQLLAGARLRRRPRSRRSSTPCTGRSSRRWPRAALPFHGVLYAGLMIGADGPKVLEFNARFGDPETQAVLPRLRSDLVDLFLAAREPGGLAGIERRVRRGLGGDPGPRLGRLPGELLEGRRDPRPRAGGGELAEVTHAGTAERDGEIVTAGGRVLNVTGARRRRRPRRAIVRTMRRGGSPSTECRSAPTSPPAPSSASPV